MLVRIQLWAAVLAAFHYANTDQKNKKIPTKPLASATAMADAAACSICMEPMAPTESHRGGSGCAHAFCGACLSGHVRAKVDAGAGAAVRCPDASCAGALDPELCHGTLPADLFVRWCAALCESMFLGARRTYYLFRDCSEMMVADDEDEGSEDCVTQTECQVCRRLFCARCGVPWHAGVSCGEFQRLDVGERAQADPAAHGDRPGVQVEALPAVPVLRREGRRLPAHRMQVWL
ncbi:hypothetical protein BRADI_3g37440v3 [Brachypodium distachyon]|uniref:RBR-type E3 ubiquitin transferase n=1 Tax=Brachypodium distachyon TaxID=15368 RepID=A0A0Q3QA19_BRADI|nr:hypothetical protein BRADI_3g37440v3 [Brachypodium distachyon]